MILELRQKKQRVMFGEGECSVNALEVRVHRQGSGCGLSNENDKIIQLQHDQPVL